MIVCEALNVYYFQKTIVSEESRHFGARDYHTFIVIFKVKKSLKGNLAKNSNIACYVRFVDEKLELKGDYFLGFDGKATKVFIVEPGQLCPVSEITERNR